MLRKLLDSGRVHVDCKDEVSFKMLFLILFGRKFLFFPKFPTKCQSEYCILMKTFVAFDTSMHDVFISRLFSLIHKFLVFISSTANSIFMLKMNRDDF